MPQVTRYGFLGPVDVAVVEAADITRGRRHRADLRRGRRAHLLQYGGAGASIELNRHHPPTLLGLHDIYEPQDPPYRKQIPIYTPSDRIGSPIITLDPAKIVGVVETDLRDEARGFSDVHAR